MSALPILYSFRRCPYAMRARLALCASEQVCELREVVLRYKPAELLAASPKATVPVLVDAGGEVIAESLDIMLWALRRNDLQGWLTPEQGSAADMLALIGQCDDQFKYHLDRYKYPDRYAGADRETHRMAGAEFLHGLEQRLRDREHLCGTRVALADMAIVPFVRQFASVDAAWFKDQPWLALHRWLSSLTGSRLFERVMVKVAPWQSGTRGITFAGKELTCPANVSV